MNTEILKDVVVIYHADCPDGFGAAYAAWKKFGDTASYIPCPMPAPVPEGIVGKELYIVDYSYNQEILQELIETNVSVVVIDHHQSNENAVRAFPQNVFDTKHSGAVLAWQYFHPSVTVPSVLLYVEDHDIWNHSLPQHIEFNVALHQTPRTFSDWDRLIENLKDTDFLHNFLEKGKILAEFEGSVISKLTEIKERVFFEGHEVWALNFGGHYKSILGNILAEENQKTGGIALGIIYSHANGKVNISLRSKGDVDVAKIAEKYGGGGHKNAARIQVSSFNELPFTFIKKS
jgi:nanoRNase/pAp phosphatase (c-di-AMP/oligoRNAs hydrolase)